MKIILVLSILMINTTYAETVKTEFSDKDIQSSWNEAELYLPEQLNPYSIESLNKGPTPKKIVLFMHGCTGIGKTPREWGRILSSKGYAVIVPDSFAIEGVVQSCDTVKKSKKSKKLTKLSRKVRKMEIRIALENLKSMDILNKSKIALMGHSQGGRAVVDVDGVVFSAVISSVYGCKRGRLLETNYMIPAEFIYSKSDPWLDRYYTDDVRINCENTGNLDNPLNREFVADGEKHSLVGNTDAVDFVLNFLTKHLN
jgi:dienelactone hydrolase